MELIVTTLPSFSARRSCIHITSQTLG